MRTSLASCTNCWPRPTPSCGPGARRWPSTGARPARDPRAHPHLIVTAITPFGLEGPWSDKAATEFTLQAWSGGIVGLARGLPDRAPVYVGGQIGEWLSGRRSPRSEPWPRPGAPSPGGELVDVSMLEALAMCLTYYPVTFNDQLGRPMRRRAVRPDAGRRRGRATGSSVSGCGTGQQWLDFCAMVGASRVDGGPQALPRPHGAGARRSTPGSPSARVDEVLDLASAFRIPNAPIANGANVADFEHFRAREAFVAEPPRRRREPAAARSASAPAGCGRPSRPPGSASTPSTTLRAACRSSAVRCDARRAAVGCAPVRRAAGPGHDGLLGRPARRATSWRCSAPR